MCKFFFIGFSVRNFMGYRFFLWESWVFCRLGDVYYVVCLDIWMVVSFGDYKVSGWEGR